MKSIENKYYLQSVELTYQPENGYLCYRLIYSNGIIKKNIDIPFDKAEKIEIELNN